MATNPSSHTGWTRSDIVNAAVGFGDPSLFVYAAVAGLTLSSTENVVTFGVVDPRSSSAVLVKDPSSTGSPSNQILSQRWAPTAFASTPALLYCSGDPAAANGVLTGAAGTFESNASLLSTVTFSPAALPALSSLGRCSYMTQRGMVTLFVFDTPRVIRISLTVVTSDAAGVFAAAGVEVYSSGPFASGVTDSLEIGPFNALEVMPYVTWDGKIYVAGIVAGATELTRIQTPVQRTSDTASSWGTTTANVVGTNAPYLITPLTNGGLVIATSPDASSALTVRIFQSDLETEVLPQPGANGTLATTYRTGTIMTWDTYYQNTPPPYTTPMACVTFFNNSVSSSKSFTVLDPFEAGYQSFNEPSLPFSSAVAMTYLNHSTSISIRGFSKLYIAVTYPASTAVDIYWYRSYDGVWNQTRGDIFSPLVLSSNIANLIGSDFAPGEESLVTAITENGTVATYTYTLA